MSSPRLALLDATDRDFIHQRSLDLLEQVGVRFQSPKARKVLEEAGCKIDHEWRVRIPRELVGWAVEQLPRDVLLAGRDQGRDALLDGSRTYSTAAGICRYVVDTDTGLYRNPRLDDLEKATRIADALDAFCLIMYAMSPTDGVAPKMTDLAGTACMLGNTSKHVMGQVVRPAEVPYILEIIRLCGGGLKERPLFSIIYCPVAPLQHEAGAIEAAMALAAEHIPIDIFSQGLAGATAPVTLAGTIAQTNCEVLSAVVLLQLVAAGCPLIYTANAGIMDMRMSRFAASTPETILMNIAQTELAHSYNMPSLSAGHVTDSWDLGFRGGIEDIAMALATRLARPDIMIGLGTVEAGRAISFPKMVLDAELVGYLDRVLEGLAVDSEHVAAATIAKVGPGGHYLAQRETRTRIRAGEHWLPNLLNRTSSGERQRGAPSEIERAEEAVARLLVEHIPSPLPQKVSEQVNDVLTRAESELPDE